MPTDAAPDAMAVLETASQTGGLDNLSTPLQVALFLGSLGFLSAAMISLTSFTRIIIVLSFVRRALTTQEIPPNPVLIGLSLFLTLFVMGPTFDRIGTQAVAPYLREEIGMIEAVKVGSSELRVFMLKQTRKRDIALFLSMSESKPISSAEETPMRVLIPAFIISELKTSFIMGFCLFIPFLLVDLVVSTILMSMGMMMMPPVVISLPFKILLFVLVDGWHLIARALSMSFG
ncbi:MAG: flagellar type III secretion system pore protein FliP [bacterium]|nr:flagellar type III secretion system pore protein FliP [bacterium]